MALSKEDVLKVAHLARLRITDTEADRYGAQLNTILGLVEQMAGVDTDAVEPLYSPIDAPQRLRADAVTDGGCAADILANGPEVAEGFYVVQKVVE